MRWLVLAVAMLAGCSSLPRPRVVETPGAIASAGMTAAFRLDGRISVRTSDQSFSGTASWTRAAGEETLLLSGPLGQGAAEISRRDDKVELRLPDGGRMTEASDEVLIERVLGLRLGLNDLADWLSGRPRPGLAFRAGVDRAGRADWLDQGGWHIEYSNYRDWAGRVLPGRVVARRGDDLEFRFVLDHWEAE